MSKPLRPFHLAFPVDNLEAARDFYCSILGCRVGRSAPQWLDFDFHGHQITAHLVPAMELTGANSVDGDTVPVRHFGIVLSMPDWEALRDRLQSLGTAFLLEPRIRFRGKPGEQATMFVRDPSGNALEFKAFGRDDRLFATD